MKKSISLIALLLIFTLAFAGCKKEDEKLTFGDENMYDGVIDDLPLDDETIQENVVASIADLANFFKLESVDTVGETYGAIMDTARNDNYVIRPMLSGIDVSESADYARIEIKPKEKEGQYSHIAYYYTNGSYNYAIRVYYLEDSEFNVAMIGGMQALNDGDMEVVRSEKYGNFTIVTYLPDETTYAETVVSEKYFVTITGAAITNEKFPNVIEKAALDILTFETYPIDLGR